MRFRFFQRTGFRGLFSGASKQQDGHIKSSSPVRKLLTWGLLIVFLTTIPALAVHDAGMMELDGDIADSASPGGTEVPTDWGDLFSSGTPGGTPLALPTDAFDSAFVHDEADPDPSTFTGGGSKDTLDIPNWVCTSATPSPDKNNLLHSYAVIFRPTSGNKTGRTLMYVALERFANAGDANVGFWLLQDKNVGCTSGNFTGAHVDGDLLVVAAFTNGGAVAGVDLYQWSAGSLVGPIASGVDCASAAAADNVCGSTNAGTITTPWATQDKTSGPNTLLVSEFFELGLDLTGLAPAGACYIGLIAESRTSQSTTASLADFTFTNISTCTADLSITKSDSPDPIIVGNNLTYTLTVTNNGPDAADAVTVTDTLPGSVTFISAVPSQGSCSQAAGVVTCNLGTITNGANATITIVVTPTTVGTITNTATVTSNSADTNPGNDTAVEQTTVEGTDLAVTKTDSPDPVTLGNNLTYTVTVTNNGPANATGVIATDNLPPGVTFVSAVPSQGSCSQAAGVVTCNLGTINNGANATITITVTPTAAGTITNTVSVTANETDTNPNNNSDSENTTVNPSADLSIVKSDSPDPVNAGSTLTYTLQVNNAGPSTATSVTVTDTLPAGVSFISAAGSGWSCSEASGVVICTRASLAVGAAPAITITVTAPTTGSTLINTTSVNSPVSDPNPANNTDTENTTVNPVADLSIVKSDSPDPVNAGSTLTYTLQVNNAGPSTATSVTVTDTLPAGVSFISAAGSGWSCSEASGVVICTRASLAVGAAPAITITVTAPTTGGTLTNTANVTSSTSDPNTSNNNDSENTTVVEIADLSLTKTDSPDPVNAGATLTYTLQVSNSGPSTATSVVMTDILPPGATFVSASGSGWSCSEAAGVVTCTRASLSVGVGPSIAVTIIVNAPTGGGTITNTATVTSSTSDPDPNNNTDSENTTVTPIADLSIIKNDSPDPVSASATLTYTLLVNNAGPSTATSVTVTDTLPAGVTFISATGSGWSCSQAAGTVTCTRASLSVGAAPTITITVTAPANGGTITNTVSVTSSTSDPDPSNNTDSEDTTVNPLADLSINKTDSPDPVSAGGTLIYTLAVSNAGPSTATTISVSDPLPAGATFISATGSGWSCSEAAGVVTCTRASLSVGAAPNITITITAPVNGGPFTIANTASVTSSTPDPNTNNNTDTENTTVTPNVDLAITKSDSPDPVNASGTLTYTLSVTNNGPSTASSLTVTDTLPAGVTFVSASGSGWSCSQASNIVTCTRASLSVGAAPNITIIVTAPANGGTITNTATVSSSDTDSNPSNNTDTEITTVASLADLSIIKGDSPDPVNANGVLSYTLQVNNAGPSTAVSVSVSDTLPAGTIFVSASGGGWSCSHAAGVVTCTRASLAVGAAPTITITVTAPSEGGTITDTATVTSSTPDPNTGNNTDTEDTTVTPVADLAIVKSDSPDPVNASATLTYTLQITNNGPSTAANVTVVDTLPAGTTFISASGAGWSCGQAAGIVTCTMPSLPVGVAAPITVTVTAPSEPGVISNPVNVSSSTTDSNLSNNNDVEDTVITGISDLSILKSDNPDPVNAGATLTYTLQVNNAGPSTAVSVSVSDTLPAGTTFISASGNGWNCSESGGVITCTTASLAVGVAPAITVTVSAPNEGGTITDTATVSSANTDPNPNDNTDSEDTTVIPVADLAIVKSDNPDPVNALGTLTYTVQVTNNGPSTATGVSVSDTLPGGVTFVSASGTGWNCSQAAGVVTCNLMSNLSVGAAAPITIIVTVPADATTLTNITTVTSATQDLNPSNNTDAEETAVTPVADLRIVKTHSGTLYAGQTGVYTLTVTNNGPSIAAGPITVIEDLPAGMSFVSGVGTNWSCSAFGQTATCINPNSMVVGEVRTITLTVSIGFDIAMNVVNVSSVSSLTSDPNPQDNTDDDPTEICIAEIHGVKYLDINGNGNHDGNEPFIPKLTVTLNGTDGNGNTISLTTQTDAKGEFVFRVPPGTYIICEVIPNGYTQTFPRSGPQCTKKTFGHEVTVNCGDVKNINNQGQRIKFANMRGESPRSELSFRAMQALSVNGNVQFMAEGLGIQDLDIQVYNLKGQAVYRSGRQPNGFLWTLQNQSGQRIANGIYLYTVTVRGEDGKSVKTKLQKFVVTQDEKQSSQATKAFSITSVQAVLAANAIHFLAGGQGSFKDMQVRVFDINGKPVYTSQWESNGLAWSLQSKQGKRILSGVYLYLITVRSPDGATVVTKLQKLVIKQSK